MARLNLAGRKRHDNHDELMIAVSFTHSDELQWYFESDNDTGIMVG